MDGLKGFFGKTIGLDTAPIIYYIEDRDFLEVLDPFFESLKKGEFKAVTSTITLLEVLVHPYRKGDPGLAEKYREILLNSENLRVLPVLNYISISSASIRAKYGISTPDALQIATALNSGATMFLTNDSKLKKAKRSRSSF